MSYRQEIVGDIFYWRALWTSKIVFTFLNECILSYEKTIYAELCILFSVKPPLKKISKTEQK